MLPWVRRDLSRAKSRSTSTKTEGLRFLYWSIEILREKDPDAPMATFKFSITYLMVLFIAMLADHWILGTPV